MIASRWSLASLVSLLAPGLGPEPGTAQEVGAVVRGQVVEAVWMSAVAGADVILLDSAFLEVRRTTSDATGRFSLTTPAPGAYLLQARADNFASGPVGPLELTAADEPEEVVLPLPSERVLAVLRCLDEGRSGGTGVVLGIAHEALSHIGVPGTRVQAEWSGEGEASGGTMSTLSDGGGRFFLCGVPAGRPLTLRAQVLGRSTEAAEEVVAEAGGAVRADLPMELGAVEEAPELVAVNLEKVPDEPGMLVGRLVDASTDRPVPGAAVRMPMWGRTRETGPDGRFRFARVERGTHILEVEHLAFGVQQTAVEMTVGGGLRLDLRIEPRAVALEGIDVTARAPIGMASAEEASPFPGRGMAGETLAELDRQGATVISAIRQIGGGVVIRGGRGRTACIEARRRATGMQPSGGCQMVEVVVDGVPVLDGIGTLRSLQLADLESIHYMSPLEAGFRYGMEASARGAVVLWTRGRGPHRSREREEDVG